MKNIQGLIMLNKDLLEILACPKCKGSLEYNEEKNILICHTCRVRFPITDGIPELLPDRAEPLKLSNISP